MSRVKSLFLLLLFLGVLLFTGLGKYPLQVPDSARYAEIPREMVATGDYITPHLNGIKYLEKPPLFYWMQAGAIKVFGINDFAVNITNAVLALLCCWLVYGIGRRLYGHWSGILAGAVLATSFLFFTLTRIITLDMAFTTMLTATFGCFLYGITARNQTARNYYMWGMYACAALAVLTKGLIGFIFPCAIIFFWVLLCKQWRELKTYCIFTGIILCLLIAVPWHILVQLKNPEFFDFYFLQQHFLRYFTLYASRSQAWWFLPVALIGGFLPWIAFLWQSIRHGLSKCSAAECKPDKAVIFMLIWAVVPYLAYTFSESQLLPYLLPIFPPLAVLVGRYLAAAWQQQSGVYGIKPGLIGTICGYICIGIGCFVAPSYIDFAEMSVAPSFFYLAGGLALSGGILVALLYWLRGVKYGIVGLIFVTTVFLVNVGPFIPIVNNKSIKPLVVQLSNYVHADDLVFSYNTYYQDLPFYLNRDVIVVNRTGELTFGLQHQAVVNTWMQDKEFWRIWNGDKRAYMVVEYDNLPYLTKKTKKLHLVARYLQTALFSNQKT